VVVGGRGEEEKRARKSTHLKVTAVWKKLC
jgi:hypothetical protein